MIIGSSIPSIPREVAPLFAYDKVLHFIEYAGFAWLWGLLARVLFPGMLRGRIWLMIVLLAAVWGAFDEVYQGMIGRSQDLTDWIADVLGASVAQAIQEYLARRKGRGRNIGAL